MVSMELNEALADDDEPSRKRKVKISRDPLLPKRPANAFVLYCKENRAKLMSAHPEMSFGDVAAALGDSWQVLSLAEKKPYEDMAKEDRARHARELEAYRAFKKG